MLRQQLPIMPIPEVIPTKQDYILLSGRGALGNVFRSWPNLAEFLADDYQGWTTIRNRQPMGKMAHWVAPGRAFSTFWEMTRIDRVNEADLYIQEVAAPDNERILNFELCRSPEYFWLTYGATPPDPGHSLRKDLGLNARFVGCGNARKGRVSAYSMLKTFLDEEDFEDLQSLFDAHPHATIEASLYQRPVGTLCRRLIIWEVRDY